MLTQLPNPISVPSWWQLINWIADPIGFQKKYSQKYGDIFSMQLAGIGSFVILGEPQAIQEIFTQDSRFDIGRGNKLAEPLIGRTSLMLMDGDRHRRERKLLMPPFHGEKLQAYAQQICLITHQIASQWQIGQPFVARSAMQKLSLEVIIQIVFGLANGERYQQIKPLFTDWLNMTDSPLRSSMLFLKSLQQDWGNRSPWGQMKYQQRCIYDLLQAEIEEKRTKENERRGDVLSLMMAARDENGQAMTDEELKDELLTILFAGHETTATTIAWAFYQIFRNVNVREKLQQELDSLGENPNPMEIAQLPYLTAVCQETLRMYPVLPTLFPRITKSSINIAGYQLEPNTTLMASIYLIHYREDLYPHPQQFRPERFIERQYSPSEYIPFGGGSRRCLGYALALLEIKLVIATVLSNYQLALAEDKPIKVQRRGFTLAPEGGVRMIMTGKKSLRFEQSNKIFN
ncbi:Cytochrome P450 [Trichormus variabilis ATCC 29413]|uniref:Cytochrome P450 n=2 Tax=Anabaena variabilis TaxID=264691 RepID=Q59163_TRIV2|nr:MULTISPECIES: cytochrome P450 [Nostocaceae]AAA80677.1 cytochrome P450 [Trichormus variabilis ATCC 29413]ABA23526.1 Cytochrome P450 [Trichormus variabilis ATCC 29413]MBC1215356.1 cytochrome P450 [Trichormus variabilis ARAD]MBC1254232.1 cytochrome P450 [Trichormus variabilis V5]MBC1302835.1 cytochrome P450 [Trichormus variabilis N2B]